MDNEGKIPSRWDFASKVLIRTTRYGGVFLPTHGAYFQSAASLYLVTRLKDYNRTSNCILTKIVQLHTTEN